MSVPVKILLPGRPGQYPNYETALRRAGALPVWGGAGGANALLLPGGGDVAPARYGAASTAAVGVDTVRDSVEFALTEAFLTAGRPILGICRGHQVLNVALGGTLFQHMEGHAAINGVDRVHICRTQPDSFVGRLYGGACVVNSAHHQAVERPGDRMRPVQWAPDGTVEAMEHEFLPVWCVQWHPERLRGNFAKNGTADGDLLFRAFLDKCRYAAKK